jgi:hypothetical protein
LAPDLAPLVERGRLLGLPCSMLGSVQDAMAVRRAALGGDDGALPVLALDGLVVVDLSRSGPARCAPISSAGPGRS